MADILMYAPTGLNIPKERIGGAETGVKRSIEMLNAADISIELVEKPTTWNGLFKYFIGFIKALIEVNQKLGKDSECLFYLVGFYERQAFCEALLCFCAKKHGCKIVYEPKNGSMVRSYKNGNALYKKLMNYIFANAEVVFCQGMEYKDFLDSEGYKNAIYHPNYISMKNLSLFNRSETKGQINFVFVGRVAEDKNIGFVVSAFAKIHEVYQQSKLFVIGGWQDEYKAKIDSEIKSRGIENAVIFTGRQDFAGIAGKLNQSHFFLFPSKNAMEGHSNALTEAMAFGVVPIASNYGFNRSIVGIDELILEEFDDDKYAETAIRIINSGKWEEYSKRVRNHVLNKFCEPIVQSVYLNAVKKALGKQ